MSLALPIVDAKPIVGSSPANGSALPGLLGELLRQQQETAVEKFAQWHEHEASPLQARYYRELLPATAPGPGEQYAFEVNLDACSGCKACVVACHHLNGLEEEETWRSVGLLHGGSTALPVLQHVTTACHHCVEPACLDGCPTEAYEKDPVTGIVRHLDDQCFGCQYCILKCPYVVPKYSHSKGIVRKCDMCRHRLAAGEAPACVQACPNQAIRITIVSQQDVAESAEANLFLPGAPEPGFTLPSTVYKTAKPLPANLLPADYYEATPQHAHWPLVLMLVLTQMSVGAFLVDQILSGLQPAADLAASPATRLLHLGSAFVLGMIGLAASVFHLGRPWLAYRAVIAWRTSWLSREALAFGLFAGSASLYAATAFLEPWGLAVDPFWERCLGVAVATSGLAGVFCSAMIYASTGRVFWNLPYTGLKFLLTCLVLGIPIALLMQLAAAAGSMQPLSAALRETSYWLCLALIATVGIKLLVEGAVFGWLTAPTFTPVRRTAMLMTGDLGIATFWRFAAGLFGGVVLPALLLATNSSDTSLSPLIVVVTTIASLALSFWGEVLERYLFFAAVVAPKMPGAPST